MARKTAVLSRKQRLALWGAKHGVRAHAAGVRIRHSLSRPRKKEPAPRRPPKRALVLVTVTGTGIVALYLVRKRISPGREDEGADYGAAAPASAGGAPAPASDPKSTANGSSTEDSAASSDPDARSSTQKGIPASS
jgi:hypothetical protein